MLNKILSFIVITFMFFFLLFMLYSQVDWTKLDGVADELMTETALAGLIISIIASSMSAIIIKLTSSYVDHNKKLNGMLGYYYCYYLPPRTNPNNNIVVGMMKIYRKFEPLHSKLPIGRVRVELKLDNFNKPHLGFAQENNGLVYIRTMHHDKKHEDFSIINNMPTCDPSVLFGTWTTVTKYKFTPSCGIQILSQAKLPENVLTKILNKHDTITFTINESSIAEMSEYSINKTELEKHYKDYHKYEKDEFILSPDCQQN